MYLLKEKETIKQLLQSLRAGAEVFLASNSSFQR